MLWTEGNYSYEYKGTEDLIKRLKDVQSDCAVSNFNQFAIENALQDAITWIQNHNVNTW